MPIADYAHWNEETERVWWEEEGKHAESDAEAWREDWYTAEDAFAEELSERYDDELFELLADKEYLSRYPRAKALIEWEINYRGLAPADRGC